MTSSHHDGPAPDPRQRSPDAPPRPGSPPPHRQLLSTHCGRVAPTTAAPPPGPDPTPPSPPQPTPLESPSAPTHSPTPRSPLYSLPRSSLGPSRPQRLPRLQLQEPIPHRDQRRGRRLDQPRRFSRVRMPPTRRTPGVIERRTQPLHIAPRRSETHHEPRPAPITATTTQHRLRLPTGQHSGATAIPAHRRPPRPTPRPTARRYSQARTTSPATPHHTTTAATPITTRGTDQSPAAGNIAPTSTNTLNPTPPAPSSTGTDDTTATSRGTHRDTAARTGCGANRGRRTRTRSGGSNDN